MTKAAASGLSPVSITDYHVMLHGIFRRAVRDRVILLHNPCAETELPKAPPRKRRILTSAEFDRLLELPSRFHDLVLTDIETGLRRGELVALRPRHLDFLRRLLSIEESIVEVSKRNSLTGQRMVFKPYPKDREFRTPRVSQDLTERLAARIQAMDLTRDDLFFPSTAAKGSVPLSRNAFRTRTGYQHSNAPTSPSGYACTTFVTHTRRGYSRVAPTSRP